MAVDAGAIHSIVQNMISNAIKFTERGGVAVRLAVAGAPEPCLRLDVEDTGLGIGEEFRAQLFEPFTREEDGWRRPQEGSGVGLAVTERLVSISGGRVSVDSEKGRGSRFTVTLPLAEAAPESPEAAPRAAQERLRVLLVEDQQDARDVLIDLLDGDDFAVVGEPDAERAYMNAEANDFDAFLVDIHLGRGPSGLDLMEQLRRLPRYADRPMVAITAYALPSDKERLLEAGFDGYVSKPFSIATVREALLDAVRRRRSTGRASVEP